MNVFTTQQKRTLPITILLSLLLAVAIAFGCIGFGAWYGVQDQLQTLDAQFTTTAIPTANGPWGQLLYNQELEVRLPLIQQPEMNLPGNPKEDLRMVLGAHIENTQRLTALELGLYDLTEAFDFYSAQLSVVAVRCENVTQREMPMTDAIFDERGDIIGYDEKVNCSYHAEFTVLENIHASSAYGEYPLEVTNVAGPFTADREVPFQPGQTYLLFGMSGDFPVTEYLEGGDIYAKLDLTRIGNRNWRTSHASGSKYKFNYLIAIEEQQIEDHVYECLLPDSLPFYAAYEGSWEDFLNSDEGTIWRETIIPLCDMNYASAEILLTDNIDSTLTFNDGTASILEGRTISREEYTSGADVCLVSAAYAEKNGLAVGDTISADLYKIGQHDTQVSVTQGMMVTDERVNLFGPLREENKLNLQKEYTIVGIYTAPEFPWGYHNFTANTIIAPKASVPKDIHEINLDRQLLYSIILENGSSEAFEETMVSMGLEGAFEYYDQGYTAAAAPMLAAEENALRLLLISIGAFLLGAALYLVLMIRRAQTTVRSARLLGIKIPDTHKQLFGMLSVMILLATVVGLALGAALFGFVSSSLLSQQLALQPASMILSAVTQMAIVILAAYIWTRIIAGKDLMQSK